MTSDISWPEAAIQSEQIVRGAIVSNPRRREGIAMPGPSPRPFSRRLCTRRNPHDDVVEFGVRDAKIVVRLQIDPELRRGLEVPAKPQRGVGSDAALTATDFLDPVARHTQGPGEFPRCQLVLGHEVVPEDFPGMDRARLVTTHGNTLSVVIGNFNVEGVTVFPDEANAPLLIDTNAVLSFAVTPQSFKIVRWRHPKVVECDGRIQLRQTPLRSRYNFDRKPLRDTARADSINPPVFDRFDHIPNVFFRDTSVKRTVAGGRLARRPSGMKLSVVSAGIESRRPQAGNPWQGVH